MHSPIWYCVISLSFLGLPFGHASLRDSQPASLVTKALPDISPHAQTTGSQRPIAAAWLYLSDNATDYDVVPAKWNDVDFTTVDRLMIAPAGIQPGGTFGLLHSQAIGDLSTRFKWAVDEAKRQNPKIQLFVSQFWGGNPETWGQDLIALRQSDDAAIDKYAGSVADFLTKWPSLDGYDVDYEDTNVQPNFAKIMKAVRAKLNKLAATTNKRYWTSVSPADTRYLQGAISAIDFVNMQTYAGGSDINVKEYTDIGVKLGQLLYGYNAEQPQTGSSIEKVVRVCEDRGLAGVHTWRLNSSDQKAEGKRQREIYERLRGS